jgi:hypothetical protein
MSRVSAIILQKSLLTHADFFIYPTLEANPKLHRILAVYKIIKNTLDPFFTNGTCTMDIQFFFCIYRVVQVDHRHSFCVNNIQIYQVIIKFN